MIARVLAPLLVCATLACDDDGGSAATTPCGSGEPRLELGVGDPFQPRPAGRFAIEAGRQGGHHVDVSVRLRGAFDPDRVDLELRLFDDRRRLSRVEEADWFLHVDETAAACDYLKARLVLVDAEGGLLEPAAFSEIVDAPLRLEVRIAGGEARVDADFVVELSYAPET